MTTALVPELCYTCDAPATSREHVPPRAFFPAGFRDGGLWTVPSCATHNLDNSQDVEYVRNAISIQRGTNDTAEKSLEIAKRSWDRSPALFSRTFHDIREVMVGGDFAGVFTFDLQRVQNVMDAVVHALSFRDNGRQHTGEWRVFCATLVSKTPSVDWDRFRNMLMAAEFEEIPTPQPTVFRYGIHRMDRGFIYRLVFYDAFVVFAWPVQEGA